MSIVYRYTVVTMIMFLIVSILLEACSPPPGNPDNGKKWFMMHNCYACHGKNAKNGKAPVIARIDRSFGSFLRFIRNPDSAIMPVFPEEVLSRQDAADIYAWLQSLPEK
ncbi:MAG TPA: cytochrome c [Desulfobulbus sp.]|nr:cytochrome c [Desulfobulbus sp.]